MKKVGDLKKLKNQSTGVQGAQFLVAESYLLQHANKLEEATKILVDAQDVEKNLDASFWSELAIRSFFAGKIETAFIAGEKASKASRRPDASPLSNKAYKAKVALGDLIHKKLRGDYSEASDIAFETYARYETDEYENLDVRWVGATDYLRGGQFIDAERQNISLTDKVYGQTNGQIKFVEGPAEYSMWVSIIKKDWKAAYISADYVLKLHNCAEPTKIDQGVRVHGPWIQYLASRAGISRDRFKFPESCEVCSEIQAHRIIFEANGDKNQVQKGMLLLDTLRRAHPAYPKYEKEFERASELSNDYSTTAVDNFFFESFTAIQTSSSTDLSQISAFDEAKLGFILDQCILNGSDVSTN